MTTVKPLPLYGFSVLAEATVGYLFKSPLNLIWSSDSALKLLQFLLVAARKEKKRWKWNTVFYIIVWCQIKLCSQKTNQRTSQQNYSILDLFGELSFSW